MANERLCDCGSVANWEEVGSTWICTACRDKDIQKTSPEIKEALARMEQAESTLRMFKANTGSIYELLTTLKDQISRIA